MPRRTKKKYPLDPTFLSENVWFYEEPRGLLLVQKIDYNGKYVTTTQTRIPWHRLRSAMTLHDEIKRHR